MLAHRDGRVFVGQRIDRDHDAWQMPQGGIDRGESVEEAALRELREETGVTADRVRIEAVMACARRLRPAARGGADDLGRQISRPGTALGAARYLGEDDEIDIATAHPEFSRWRWADAGDLVAADRAVQARPSTSASWPNSESRL